MENKYVIRAKVKYPYANGEHWITETLGTDIRSMYPCFVYGAGGSDAYIDYFNSKEEAETWWIKNKKSVFTTTNKKNIDFSTLGIYQIKFEKITSLKE